MNQGFYYYFCLMIEGSGSGSRRPKSIRIRRIRIRFQFGICNTDFLRSGSVDPGASATTARRSTLLLAAWPRAAGNVYYQLVAVCMLKCHRCYCKKWAACFRAVVCCQEVVAWIHAQVLLLQEEVAGCGLQVYYQGVTAWHAMVLPKNYYHTVS
jgi:hypothetical protein